MKTKILSLILVFAMAVCLLASCGEKPGPDPIEGGTCTNHTPKAGSYASISDTQHTYVCQSCNTTVTENHNFKTVTSGGQSVSTCSACGKTITTGEGGGQTGPVEDLWAKEQQALYDRLSASTNGDGALKITGNINSHRGELESGFKNYLAGSPDQEESSISTLEKSIRARNAKAAAACGLTNVEYDYTSLDQGWGGSLTPITNWVNGGASGAADIYVSEIYSMVGCSLRGLFINLLSEDAGAKEYMGFNSEHYDAEVDDRGYMMEYMSVLSFSTKAMYLVASDYFIDLPRAYFACPVSVKVLNTATAVTGDQNEDGEIDLSDFFQLIDDRGWSWEKISQYAAAIKRVNPDTGNYDIKGGVNAYAVTTSSAMTMAGICYSNDIRLLTRTIGDDGEYVFTYNMDEAEKFFDLGLELRNYLGIEGILSVGNTDGVTDVMVVQNAFAADRLLVGGAVMLGSIEQEVYQNMWDDPDGGFAVAPMPMTATSKDYTTVIHNMGRLGAIAKNSHNVAGAAAYLNYVSTNSTDILNQYYTVTLTRGAAGGLRENIPIIAEFRNQMHTDDCTKVVDDAFHLVGADAATKGNNRWHVMLATGNPKYSQADTIRDLFMTAVQAKQSAVLQLQQEFINYVPTT